MTLLECGYASPEGAEELFLPLVSVFFPGWEELCHTHLCMEPGAAEGHGTRSVGAWWAP